MLNIPVQLLDVIDKKENILLAGIGGDFDVLGAMPLYYTLKARNKKVHLSNFGSTDFKSVAESSSPIVINPDLIAATATIKNPIAHFPEGYLSEWFKIMFQEDIPIWMFKKVGVIPLRLNYEHLIKELGIDMIILIDSGMDSLNTGVEEGCGTLLSDSITIAALSQINGIDKIVVTTGFATEIEQEICNLSVLRNIAAAIKNEAYFGCCSMTKNMVSYKMYEKACVHVFNENEKTSPVHRRIIPSIEGEFGNFHATNEDVGLEICVSPLMSIMWFFNFQTLTLTNKLISYLLETITFDDAVQAGVPIIKGTNTIPWIPLPY